MPLTQSLSPQVQDYLKAIYALSSRHEAAVGTNELAQRLGVTPGSVSAMMGKLAEQGLIERHRYYGVQLTDYGRRVALEVLRHHRLLELFLNSELGIPWDQVHAEAEVLEHALSEKLERVIADRLGDPRRDPHGDPIPTADLEIEETPTCAVSELSPGSSGRFTRVSDADPEKLRYLAELGIGLGMEIMLLGREPFGGPVCVQVNEQELLLGEALARSMRIVLEASD